MSFIHSSVEDRILTIRFNRPDKKNAILRSMYADAAAAMRAAQDDANVRVAVITGEGGCFTAGNDLKDFLEVPPVNEDAEVFQFMFALSSFTKPVIAAVNGLAIGIGTTLLFHCDLAYAVPETTFQMPFINLGVVPEFASSLLAPRLFGRAAASELLLLGEPFGAERAKEIGLINAVVPAADLAATVGAKAKALAAKPPGALRDAKALMLANAAEIRKCIVTEARIFGERLQTPEFKEAATAFFEKRAPDFSRFS
ncbi:MAG: enoyl-CoA hydratase [Rhodospirillaceae bacterium]